MRLSDRKKLIEALLLIKENNHISVSFSGLRQRSVNRDKAIKELSAVLHISAAELDKLYIKRTNKVKETV